MLVHEKSGRLRQFEWYRDNICIYYRLKHRAWGGFFDIRNFVLYIIKSFEGCTLAIFSPNSKENFKKEKENETMKNKVLAGLLTMAMAAAMAAGCSKNTAESSTDGGDKSYTIGISQFAEHGSLDNCREGFLAGLKEEGIIEGENLTVDYKNAAADMGTTGQISDSFVSDKVDMICAIATPAAQSAYNAAMDAGIPVIYTAVTDPVAAELAAEDGTAAGEVTGTSDKLPVEAQLQMMRQILPDAKKIGIMYTTSEANSLSAIAEYKELAGNYDFEIVEKGISTTADVPLAADDLLGQVDCITNLTDNTVVASLPTILEKANEKKIPVFGSEIEQVKIGCLAAEGLDYIALGKQTGKMAAQVLKGGKKASELSYEIITEPGFYVNSKVADNLGITVPEELFNSAAESFDEITE